MRSWVRPSGVWVTTAAPPHGPTTRSISTTRPDGSASRTSQMLGSPGRGAEANSVVVAGPMLSCSHPASSSAPRLGASALWRIVTVAPSRMCSRCSRVVSWLSSWRHGVSAAQARSVTAGPRSLSASARRRTPSAPSMWPASAISRSARAGQVDEHRVVRVRQVRPPHVDRQVRAQQRPHRAGRALRGRPVQAQVHQLDPRRACGCCPSAVHGASTWASIPSPSASRSTMIAREGW